MLVLTRRAGESIFFNCANFPTVTLTVLMMRSAPSRVITVRVENTAYVLELSSRRDSKEMWLNLFNTAMVSLRLVDVLGLQARIGIIAPPYISILRDNAKVKEDSNALRTTT